MGLCTVVRVRRLGGEKNTTFPRNLFDVLLFMYNFIAYFCAIMTSCIQVL